MKIQTLKEYEANHENFKDMSDDFLVEMIKIFQETYEMLTAEAIYRLNKDKWIMEKQKSELEQLYELKSILEREIERYREMENKHGMQIMFEKLNEVLKKIDEMEGKKQ